MTRPIEAVVAEALKRLETSGRLDMRAYLSAYPEHAEELKELLPTLLELHQEKRWQKAEAESRAFAVSLFAELAPQAAAAPAEGSLGELLARERAEVGLSLEEQARRAGLSAQALEQLEQEPTPVDSLDNATIKQLATKVAVPFANLAREVRRLLSLQALSGASGQAVFTRDKETSSADEKAALMDKVREAARRPQKPPGGQDDKP